MFELQLDQVFRALASTHRRHIIGLLADERVSVLELAETLPISLSGVLQHVKVLERAALVATSKHGQVRICRLNGATLLGAEAWLRHTLWANHCPRLGSLPQDYPLLRGKWERAEGY